MWDDAHQPQPPMWGAALPVGAMPCLLTPLPPSPLPLCLLPAPSRGANQSLPSGSSGFLLPADFVGSQALPVGRRGGSEHEADAPEDNIPAASLALASVPSPAHAKPWRGHPQRARTHWLPQRQ